MATKTKRLPTQSMSKGTNLGIVVRNGLAGGGNKPSQKMGGAKRRDWSINAKHQRQYTGPCIMVYDRNDDYQ